MAILATIFTMVPTVPCRRRDPPVLCKDSTFRVSHGRSISLVFLSATLMNCILALSTDGAEMHKGEVGGAG